MLSMINNLKLNEGAKKYLQSQTMCVCVCVCV